VGHEYDVVPLTGVLAIDRPSAYGFICSPAPLGYTANPFRLIRCEFDASILGRREANLDLVQSLAMMSWRWYFFIGDRSIHQPVPGYDIDPIIF